MPTPFRWDIFCRVVDNFGDIGVCWRLARQLSAREEGAVRLWVDDLQSLHALSPRVDPRLEHQSAEGIDVRRWVGPIAIDRPARIVIDAFGCGLPEEYIRSMVHNEPRPLWITLEYLSAEPWVREHHGLPSPHPRLPLERYFFFPGFVEGTGGVLRESDLIGRRDGFAAAGRQRFWASVGFDTPAADATVVSLFGYPHAPIAALLECWEHGPESMVVGVPEGRTVRRVTEYLGISELATGRTIRRGSLEVRILPFVEQARYDELLWACDCNFVRGEDSFVRGQWAARPLVWQAYPQDANAHWQKLDAFLALYSAGLPPPAATAVRGMWRSWNGVAGAEAIGAAWRAMWAHRSALQTHARRWAGELEQVGDLGAKLAQFCRDRVQ